MLAPDPVSKQTDLDPSEISHGVCACQINNVPRLALCGYDCTDATEALTPTICIVCEDIIRRNEPCRICGGLD